MRLFHHAVRHVTDNVYNFRAGGLHGDGIVNWARKLGCCGSTAMTGASRSTEGALCTENGQRAGVGIAQNLQIFQAKKCSSPCAIPASCTAASSARTVGRFRDASAAMRGKTSSEIPTYSLRVWHPYRRGCPTTNLEHRTNKRMAVLVTTGWHVACFTAPSPSKGHHSRRRRSLRPAGHRRSRLQYQTCPPKCNTAKAMLWFDQAAECGIEPEYKGTVGRLVRCDVLERNALSMQRLRPKKPNFTSNVFNWSSVILLWQNSGRLWAAPG